MERSFDEDLAAHDRIEGDVEKKTRQHCRDRCRALCMRIREPVVKRGEADLGSVADEEKHECEREHRRLELGFHRVEMSPEQRRHSLRAQYLLGSEVEENRSEERLGDADAAENEVLPARLQAPSGAVERDEEYRRERRTLHRHPE